jgi:hypothetical protein
MGTFHFTAQSLQCSGYSVVGRQAEVSAIRFYSTSLPDSGKLSLQSEGYLSSLPLNFEFFSQYP